MDNQFVKISTPSEPLSEGPWKETHEAVERIRERAYFLSQARGCSDDQSVDDWLRAERELFEVPESELAESSSTYNLQVALPGFRSNQLDVIVERRSITVHGTDEQRATELFHRLELPLTIDADRAKASLAEGVLSIVLPKADIAGSATNTQNINSDVSAMAA